MTLRVNGKHSVRMFAANSATEELQQRYYDVLETLSSLQQHFFDLYTSKSTQCKMYYSDSPACDSFQLGEMVKFFIRKGLMNFQSVYAPSADSFESCGDILLIVARLQECPSYQMDQNPTRCGLRTRLLVPLSRLNPRGQVGICLACWTTGTDRESWQEDQSRGKAWTFSPNIPLRWDQCKDHGLLRDMFTAKTRDWTPKPS